MLLATGIANAEWVLIEGTNIGDTYSSQHTYYYNTEDIERFQDYSRVWIRTVYNSPRRNGVTRAESQVDFKHMSKQTRPYFDKYLDSEGKVVRSGRASKRIFKWWTAKPDSVNLVIWKACSKL